MIVSLLTNSVTKMSQKMFIIFYRKVRASRLIQEEPMNVMDTIDSFCSDFSFWHEKNNYFDEKVKNYTIVRHYATYKNRENAVSNETKSSCFEKSPLWLNGGKISYC